MDRDTRQVLAIFLILIAVSVAAVYIIGVPLPNIGEQLFVPLSISLANFDSNDPKLGGQAWLLTTAATNFGSYAVGYLQPGEQYVGGNTTKYPLEIDTRVNSETCQYKATTTTDALYKLDADPWQGPYLNPSGYLDKCMGRPNYAGYVIANPQEGTCPAGFGKCYSCYFIREDSLKGVISTPDLLFDSDIALKVNGDTETININSVGPGFGYSESNIAYAEWAGNLDTGRQCPDADTTDTTALYKFGSGWRTTSLSGWNQYTGATNGGTYSGEANAFVNCVDTYSDPDYCEAQIDQATNAAETASTIYSNCANINSAQPGACTPASSTVDQNTGLITLDVPNLVQFPIFSIRVRAYWLGIFTPVGAPHILSASSNPFSTTRTGYIRVDYENSPTASAEEAFSVYAQCTPGFSQSGGTITSPVLSPGQEFTSYIPISGSCPSGNVSGTCTVTVAGRGSTDSRQVGVTCLTQHAPCTDGAQACNGPYRQVCSGGVWTNMDSQPCPYTCDTQAGLAVCTTAPAPPSGECAWWDVICHANNIANDTLAPIGSAIEQFFASIGIAIELLRVILSFVGALVGFQLAWKYSEDKFGKTEREQNIRLIVSAALGILAGILVHSQFWSAVGLGTAIIIVLAIGVAVYYSIPFLADIVRAWRARK